MDIWKNLPLNGGKSLGRATLLEKLKTSLRDVKEKGLEESKEGLPTKKFWDEEAIELEERRTSEEA